MSAWCKKCGHLAGEGDYLLGVNEEVCWSCQAEQYKAERDDWRQRHSAMKASLEGEMALHKETRAERDALLADAERYRWMKANVRRIPLGWEMIGWDDAIDAARGRVQD